MTEKEAQEILDELNTVRSEMLNENAKRLFEAVMQIADERDELQNKLKKIYEIVHYNCYYPELENYSNDLDDDDIKEIIGLLKGFEN